MEEQNKNFKSEQKMASDLLKSALISLTTLLSAMFIFAFFSTWFLAILNLTKLISRLGDSTIDMANSLYSVLFLFFISVLIFFYKKKPSLINNLIYIILVIVTMTYVWAISRGQYLAKVYYFPGLATVLQTILIILISKTRGSKNLILLSVIFSLVYLSMYFIMIININ